MAKKLKLTPAQLQVLTVLAAGGNLTEHEDNNSATRLLCDRERGGVAYVRKATIQKLVDLNFIDWKFDTPALGITTFFIKPGGRSYIEKNNVQPSA